MRLIWAGMIILGVGGYSVTSAAQDEAIYSWKDEDGTIHFSETPPEGVDATAFFPLSRIVRHSYTRWLKPINGFE